jgi:hypothetical protein
VLDHAVAASAHGRCISKKRLTLCVARRLTQAKRWQQRRGVTAKRFVELAVSDYGQIRPVLHGLAGRAPIMKCVFGKFFGHVTFPTLGAFNMANQDKHDRSSQSPTGGGRTDTPTDGKHQGTSPSKSGGAGHRSGHEPTPDDAHKGGEHSRGGSRSSGDHSKP